MAFCSRLLDFDVYKCKCARNATYGVYFCYTATITTTKLFLLSIESALAIDDYRSVRYRKADLPDDAEAHGRRIAYARIYSYAPRASILYSCLLLIGFVSMIGAGCFKISLPPTLLRYTYIIYILHLHQC